MGVLKGYKFQLPELIGIDTKTVKEVKKVHSACECTFLFFHMAWNYSGIQNRLILNAPQNHTICYD